MSNNRNVSFIWLQGAKKIACTRPNVDQSLSARDWFEGMGFAEFQPKLGLCQAFVVTEVNFEKSWVLFDLKTDSVR